MITHYRSDREIFLTEAKPVLKSPTSPNTGIEFKPVVAKSEAAAEAG
jgi:hypothetical protein